MNGKYTGTAGAVSVILFVFNLSISNRFLCGYWVGIRLNCGWEGRKTLQYGQIDIKFL